MISAYTSVSAKIRRSKKPSSIGHLEQFRRSITWRPTSFTRSRSRNEPDRRHLCAEPRPGTPQWKKWLSLDNRYVPPVFITLILLAGQLSYGILESYERTLLAIATSIAAELILGRIFLGKWLNVASAYITGHQRRNPCALPRLLAVRRGGGTCDHIKIRAALQGPPSLEPFQFRHQRCALLAARHRCDAQHSMGQRHVRRWW